MKILYLSSSSDFHIDLWAQFFTTDHEVYLFTDKEDYLEDMPFKNVSIINSNGFLGALLNYFKFSSHKLFQINKLISSKFYAKKIDKFIRLNNIDIVHAHNLYYGFVASFLKSDIPIIFTPMGSDIILHAQKSYVYNYMAKQTFSQIDIITGDSKLIQSQGYKLGAKENSNFIIQNGVDTKVFYPKNTNIKIKLGIKKDETLLFSPRAITPNYNIDTIIDSLSILKDKGFNFKCMFSFAFGGEYFDELKSRVKQKNLSKNIIWLGRLTYNEMADHYNASDIVISVPTSDSSPKSVYEAMFCKKPIVISNIDWTNEILSKMDCIKVTPKNIKELSEAIGFLINNDENRNSLAHHAYNTALDNFCYRTNMAKMENIMKAAVINHKKEL